ncbi:MAG: hypothetical protein OXG52_04380, partial [bacterium]|nr:hypothetical protein [bacterium]
MNLFLPPLQAMVPSVRRAHANPLDAFPVMVRYCREPLRAVVAGAWTAWTVMGVLVSQRPVMAVVGKKRLRGSCRSPQVSPW